MYSTTDRQATVITDIKMPFWSMVTFMVKWAIAAIPAAMILFGLFLVMTLSAIMFVGGVKAMIRAIVAEPSPTPVVNYAPTATPNAVILKASTPRPTPAESMVAEPNNAVQSAEIDSLPTPTPTPCYENGVKVPCQ